MQRILDRIETAPAPVILLDGPSGAGKSSLADALVAAWPHTPAPTLVRMDNLYPGWDGLAAAGEHVRIHLLEPRRSNVTARWQRYDWVEGRAGQWHTVRTDAPLVVEGCGVLTKANRALATFGIWLDADDALRKSRALARDEGAFDAHWDAWQAQFDVFTAAEAPEDLADLVLRIG